jgi:hypothetical protein
MSTIKTDTLQNVAGTLSVPVSTVVSGSAKAWVNFNGTGTVAIRAAFNVSSITDNGTGDYTVNFTTAMADANYSMTGTSDKLVGTRHTVVCQDAAVSPTTTAFRFSVLTGNTGTAIDSTFVGVSIFR